MTIIENAKDIPSSYGISDERNEVLETSMKAVINNLAARQMQSLVDPEIKTPDTRDLIKAFMDIPVEHEGEMAYLSFQAGRKVEELTA